MLASFPPWLISDPEHLGVALARLALTVVVAGALLHALDVLGRDVKPLLVGAGIPGTAPGPAAATAAREARRVALDHLREAGVRLANVSPRGADAAAGA